MSIKEVIVVEGNHDLAKLKMVDSTLDIMITNGAEIKQETLELLKEINKKRGLILMLDPDSPGEKIRRTINQYVGETKHIFMQKKDCIDTINHKVGIEHAKKEKLKEALNSHIVELNDEKKVWNLQRLMKYNLAGTKDAKKRRLKVSQALHIGKCNAKTFIERLNMLNVTEDEVIEVIQ